MINLQQIRKLEDKVLKAVEIINSLRDENKSLRERLNSYEDKILDLEELIERFKNEQHEIENGILNTIKKLDFLEDSYNTQSKKTQNESNDKEVIQPKASTLENPDTEKEGYQKAADTSEPPEIGVKIQKGTSSVPTPPSPAQSIPKIIEPPIEPPIEEELDIF